MAARVQSYMPLTSARLHANAKLQAAAKNMPALAIGAKGEHVEILQRALIDIGFALPISSPTRSGLPDGIYGNETASAVKRFQAREGLSVDGVAGAQTMARIDQILVALQARAELLLRSSLHRLIWT